MTGGRWVAVLLLMCAAVEGAAGSLVRRENAKAGTSAWRLADIAREGEIEGYGSKVSVERGESIAFYVSTTDSSYRLEVFRMGWYGGSGARRVHGPVERAGIRQPVPQPEPVTGLIECDWVDPYVLSTVAAADPTEWMSGVYIVKLTASNTRKESLIHFVVREDRRSSDVLFQCAVTRYQAYNNWGGKSLYDFNSSGSQAARKVSFDRPYTFRSGPFEFILSWEYNMVRFLEREGYDVTYATSVETHASPDMLLTRRAFLSVGHDEYWTWQMRRNVEAARDAGVDLGFFSANTCYWQMRFEASPRTGEPHRVIVSYKERALSEDPLARDGNPSNDHLVTAKFRDVPVNAPEETLIGVMYTASPVDGDIVVEKADHWVFAGTGLREGDRLPGLLGYEVDRMHGHAPPGTVRLAHSPFVATDDGETGFSDMTIYKAASGAYVFATGSIQWSWGLDEFRGGTRASNAAHQITRNVLNRFIYGDPRPKRRAVR
ncbi:MAG TPA: N,N-dimethylformamidase beta subunit family domain-containing protein [Thermoanaerobaculia bacterium]|nr:N,N-dimethylformamidase beta subunit family domain-containing protein [Thermoanaerobaculia bacterium]